MNGLLSFICSNWIGTRVWTSRSWRRSPIAPGPLIVLAGAGTGKTRTLTSRVAHLLERGTPPERILLLTFTRRAAEEMLARASLLCADQQAARRVWGGTFHAVAHRLVAEHASLLGLSQVSVIDPADVSDLIDLLRDEHGLTNDPSQRRSTSRLPRAATIADIYSRAVNTGRPARDVIADCYPWCAPHADAIMRLLKDFTSRKRARGLLDFDDLLLSWRALLEEPTVHEHLVSRWDHVLVDEYQDVNQIQVDIVAAASPEGPRADRRRRRRPSCVRISRGAQRPSAERRR